jgi:hypothetical protein
MTNTKCFVFNLQANFLTAHEKVSVEVKKVLNKAAEAYLMAIFPYPPGFREIMTYFSRDGQAP